jgi:hypothetical protein
VKITAASTLREVVQVVSRALSAADIRAVLAGGASASLHSDGDYLSHDLDYILESRVTQKQLDAAMAGAGFERSADRYVHPASAFFVEFPRGPLAIGDDDLVTPVDVRIGSTRVLTLSATDACRDRLAAFYHWSDRQSLDTALKIARRRRVDLPTMRRWSRREGKLPQFEEFVRALRQPSRPRRPASQFRSVEQTLHRR